MVLTVRSPGEATVDIAGEVREVSVEAVGFRQAEGLAAELAERAVRLLGAADTSEPVALGSLLAGAPSAVRGRLPAVIGVEAGDPFVVDLIADGPHAVVAGVTGSGKSELLITWILALCATHTTRDVSFLLADFKGGTAFDALAEVPHVTGVITDLDGSGARRALESLRAEVRWREAELARAGARDILDPRVELPRLVIVVDEFAALLGEHPELHAVFTDVAARGRALGMHLVLGTQRPSGVVRESLLANCPLRISLRVTDAERQPRDHRNRRRRRAARGTGRSRHRARSHGERRLATTSAHRPVFDRGPARDRRGDDGTASATTLAAGPAARIDLEDLRPLARDADEALLLGLADEPDRQRQRPVGVQVHQRGLLVIGSGGSGKSTALRDARGTGPGRGRLGTGGGRGGRGMRSPLSANGSTARDRSSSSTTSTRSAPRCRRNTDGSSSSASSGSSAARAPPSSLIVASAQRLGGAVARLADLLPERLVMATASRSEHIAAGGDPAHWAPAIPPGRGRLDGLADTGGDHPARRGLGAGTRGAVAPRSPLTGFVMRRSPLARAALAAWERGGSRTSRSTSSRATANGRARRVVVAGDGDEWQRHWRALATMRSDHDLVVEASCASELRRADWRARPCRRTAHPGCPVPGC